MSNGIGSISGIAKRCRCCALNVRVGSGVIDYPIVGTRKRMFNVSRGSSKVSAIAAYCTTKTTFTVTRGVGTLSLNSTTLGDVKVEGKLPRIRSRTLICLFVTSSRVASRRCNGLLSSFVHRFPGDASKCVHHTGCCMAGKRRSRS